MKIGALKVKPVKVFYPYKAISTQHMWLFVKVCIHCKQIRPSHFCITFDFLIGVPYEMQRIFQNSFVMEMVAISADMRQGK